MDSTEFCENCKREIPSVNYVMHVAHCCRNLETCRECGEPVHVSLKEQHMKESHTTAKCEFCGKDVMKSKLQDHKENSCLKKLVECETCGIELPFTKLNDHELYCRSRTELCDHCQKYVMIKDLENHVCKDYKNATEDKEIVTIPCEFCGRQIDFVDFEIHQENCYAAEDDVQIINETSSSSQNRNSFIPVDQEVNDMSIEDETSDGIHGNERRGNVKDNSIYALPCEFCNELCPSDKLYAHQSECAGNSNGDDDDDNGNDNNHTEYFNHRQRPVRTSIGPHEFLQRVDPFNMARINEMLFDSVFNSMMTDAHWGLNFNRPR